MAVILGVAAAVAGAAGVGAAAAGAVAATGDNPPGDTQEGAYQMIVGKDFGEALKFGYKQRVWARMTEIQNGVPVDRPDLTAGISIFSNEILVGASALLGANMEAEVQIQEKNPAVGIISFLYSGVYGTFQNDMRFRLLGKGEIKLKTDKVSIL